MSPSAIPKMVLLNAHEYFNTRGLTTTGRLVEEVVTRSVSSGRLSDFMPQVPVIMSALEAEYSTNACRTELFKQQGTLFNQARLASAGSVESAALDLDLSDEFQGFNMYYVNQLMNVYTNQMEDFFQSQVDTTFNSSHSPIILETGRARFLRLCLSYLLLCESMFDQMVAFNYKLLRVAGRAVPSGTPPRSPSGFARALRSEGYDKLVDGFSSVLRNGIGHAHIKIETGGNFTISDPQDSTSTPITMNYQQMKTEYYDKLTGVLNLWDLFIVMNTLERFAREELRP